MNILVLNGSPKGERSNTLQLTNAFIEGIEKTESVNLEFADIYSLNISECKGCFACWNKTPGRCIINDDMTAVIQKLLHADVIIWSFPLYYFSLPSRLKMIIDRQLPMLLPFMDHEASAGGHKSRCDLDGKRYVVISTCGFYTAKENYTAVTAQFDHMYGKDNYTALYCGQGELFQRPELRKRTEEYLQHMKAAGTEFADGSITEKTKEQLQQLLYPREVFEQMADASWGIEKGEVQRIHPTLTFTRQMAAMYHKSSWKNRDIIIEFFYTDVQKTYQIILGKDGQTVLTENFMPYTARIETPFTVWEQIGRGELDPQQAMIKHLYRVTGDFNVMIKWDEYFGTGSAEAPVEKTNMGVMLLPWITVWILFAIDSFWGGIAGIVLCAALPLAFLTYRPTVFDYISISSISLISLLSVLGIPTDLLLPASYFMFGIMWMATVFLKVPLSARYSMKHYGGVKALNNPLFIKTNRILTACWGILYLITPIWAYPLLQTPLSCLTGLFDSVLPAILGIFTWWFEKWYPKHYAANSMDCNDDRFKA